MELRGRRVMVIGLGVSGSAVARFLAARGASLILTDRRAELAAGDVPPAELRLGAEDPAWLEGVELVVVSPGVALSTGLVRAALAARLPVVGELELAGRFIDFPIIAITGTNGKSTVTTLIGEILKLSGRNVFVGGNLGTPLIEAAGRDFEIGVVEVSSYQLETIETFRPKVAVHLNLTEDHLDRYQDLAEYGRAKARIFENQGADDWAILNRDDAAVWRLHNRMRARVLSFGLSGTEAKPAIWGDAVLCFEVESRRGTIRMDEFRLPGAFNRTNAMAAAGAALAIGIEPGLIGQAMATFRGLPHRLEFVREKNRVTYLDDSKGTNVGAVATALAAVSAPVILIAGGVDKGGSYAPLREPLRDKCRLLVLYGAAREAIRVAVTGSVPIKCVETLSEAVKTAAAASRPGDTVLLSPACSSFDQFKDYAERGRVFQELVRAL
ncbi:MAG TPA: UDP-N-acetylmuramoyl-L-alanine--D-glutamate ligase [Candidatus Binataceae bacterium]|nr:UDP-N-acetylmuramoyl-L-alanine--D-glutamate ligase [Candidatus Binataceae bacterium]